MFLVKSIIALFIMIIAYPVSAQAKPVIDKVNETNTLSCGYIEYNPALTKDINTGAWQGFDYEIVKAIAERLELKLEYTASTGWATVVADLKAGKFDMMCTGFWIHPNVGKFALFTRPTFLQPVFIVARQDDTRFTATMNLNDANLKMVALEGDNPLNIAKADFPLAQTIALPNMTDFSQVLVNVADGKADFTIVDANTYGAYNENNPGKLKIVSPEKPIRIYPTSYVFNAEDFVLRDAVNAAIDELILDGTIDKILEKFDKYPHAYYRAVIPYKNHYKN